MNKLLIGKCAIVTGGAQGIGRGIVATLIEHGATVAIVDIQKEEMEKTATQLNALWFVSDISSPKKCRVVINSVVERLGGLDILVNNAAPSRNREMIGKLSASTDWSAHSELVIGSISYLVEAAEKFLPPGSSIINISSCNSSAIALEQCSWAYHVSKSGLDQLTRWLACRLGPQGIRVNAVAPALVDREKGPKLSDNSENKKIIEEIVPLGRAGRARDVGEAVVFLASPMASYITGQILTVDGGLGAREPFGVALKTAKRHQLTEKR